jgi:ABC-type oligopeptide transport system substrate-binding subunit
VYLSESEPGTIDPARSLDRSDALILSLFEGLTAIHPVSGMTMSALATHFDITADGLRYTFYLRGHPQPRGMHLPNSSDLPIEYSRGIAPPAETAPARWSDGVPITAHDFVYSWRRAVDPSTAATDGFLMYPIQNAREISAGRIPPERLAVRSPDDYSVQVDLRVRTPFFPQLASGRVFCPVPRHAIEAHGSQWTEPGRAVTSGAFTLRERRAYDRIVLARNPAYYYDARQVSLDELVFLVVTDSAPRLNLYKAGVGALVYPWVATIMPTLRRKKDFRPQPTYASEFWLINTQAPPLDDVRVRYALNMATDKQQIAELVGAGSRPARGLVPPVADYSETLRLPVSIEGHAYDVLSFQPKQAREILGTAGNPGRLECLVPGNTDAVLWAEVLQSQWRANLGLDLAVVTQELPVWFQSVKSRSFRHVAFWGSEGGYVDPTWFLDLFGTADGYGSGWNDPRYNEMLSRAHATADPALRMSRLGECERFVLGAMPFLPLCHDVQPTLRKPFLRGLGNNLLNREQFKYAWIDTNWRPL